MKNSELLTWSNISTIIIALLLGLFLGIFFKSSYSIGIRTFFHDIYVKLNPDITKDSKSIIIDRVTKDTPQLPQNDIFEEPAQKENGFIKIIKKVFIHKQKEKQTIDNIILN